MANENLSLNPVKIGWLAVKGLSMLGMLGALLCAFAFKWVHHQRPDTWRTIGFVTAGISYMLYEVIP